MKNSRLLSKLPDEITTEVLQLFLPKSLGTFKCVSSSWCDLISSRLFIDEHLCKMKAENHFSLISKSKVANPPICYEFDYDRGSPYIFRQISKGDEDYEVLGSHNGLVLFCNTKDQYSLTNPITKESLIVPNESMIFPQGYDEAWVYFGLGYDKNSDDYIIMRIAHFWAFTGCMTEVKIWSRNLNYWSSVPPFPYENPPSANAFFVGQLFHWKVSFGRALHKLATFDVIDKCYDLIDIPNFKIVPWFLSVEGLDENTICVYCSRLTKKQRSLGGFSNFFFQMHLLTYSPSGYSWSGIIITMKDLLPDHYNIFPIMFLNIFRSKIMFLIQPCGKYGSYDTISKKFELLEEHEMTCRVEHAYKYVQSLVSPFAG